MRERTVVINLNALYLTALYLAWGAVAFVIGRSDGKLAADRWWQAHQTTVTRMDLKYRGPILRVCLDSIHCTDYTVLPRCPEWDNSCGFKPGDWTGGGNPYVDVAPPSCKKGENPAQTGCVYVQRRTPVKP